MRALLQKFTDVRALVIGDLILDVYHQGVAERLCPEAPVPVFVENDTETRRGGAGNVADNLRALGCHVREIFGQTVSRKHRYMDGRHMLLRVDDDWFALDEPCTADDLQRSVEWANVVVLSDYAKGVVSEFTATRAIAEARSRGIPVVVDPKGHDWTKYFGAEVICPNTRELAMSSLGWAEVVRNFPFLVEKRGPHGIDLAYTESMHPKRRRFPARALQVFDVTGAGDTVVSVIAAVLGAQGGIFEACELANLAAGHVVSQVGTSVCTASRLNELLEAQ